MMTLLAALIDRREYILINARLDGYPANFQVQPDAVDAMLQASSPDADTALALLQARWAEAAPQLEKLVRRFGNDFLVTAELVKR